MEGFLTTDAVVRAVASRAVFGRGVEDGGIFVVDTGGILAEALVGVLERVLIGGIVGTGVASHL